MSKLRSSDLGARQPQQKTETPRPQPRPPVVAKGAPPNLLGGILFLVQPDRSTQTNTERTANAAQRRSSQEGRSNSKQPLSRKAPSSSRHTRHIKPTKNHHARHPRKASTSESRGFHCSCNCLQLGECPNQKPVSNFSLRSNPILLSQTAVQVRPPELPARKPPGLGRHGRAALTP